MSGLERVLVATDLSASGILALDRAVQVCALHGAELEALQVVADHLPPLQILRAGFGHPEQLNDKARAQAHIDLDAAVHDRAALAGIRAWGRVESGQPFVEIVHAARDLDAQLVVVGAHGRHSLGDYFMGGTAERVIRKGDRPVLMVRQPPDRPYAKVAVALDLSDHALRALTLAARLFPAAELHVIHVVDAEYEGTLRRVGASEDAIRSVMDEGIRVARREVNDLIASSGVRERVAQTIVLGGEATRLIPAEVELLGADLLAIGTHGMGGLRYVLLGSTAQHLLREVHCDVLAVRPPKLEFDLP